MGLIGDLARHGVVKFGFSPGFNLEIFYAFIIIVCSLMIYFGTKDLYRLSGHKGIRYFRLSFLYFAIAYFFRSCIKSVLVTFNVESVSIIQIKYLGLFTLSLFVYFSTMAMFYLLYSVMWKKFEGKKSNIYLFHMIAVIVALISIIIVGPLGHFIVSVFILLFVLIVGYPCFKKSRNSSLYGVYLLLFLFWIINIIDILVPNFIAGLQLLVYILSAGTFLTILYKVLTKVGN